MSSRERNRRMAEMFRDKELVSLTKLTLEEVCNSIVYNYLSLRNKIMLR